MGSSPRKLANLGDRFGERIYAVGPAEQNRDVPDWFKQLGIKQQGMRIWRRYTEPEMRELVYTTTGKRGRQLRRFFERRPLQPNYYLSLRAIEGKYLRPFAMEETEWFSMPWVC